MGSFSKSAFRKSIDKIRLENFGLRNLNKEWVCENLNFEFEAGNTYLIQGKLGDCSDLLKALAFLQNTYQGKLWVNEDLHLDMSFEEFQFYRLCIGYGFDQGGLLNNKTIFENLMLPLSYHGEVTEGEAKKLVETYLSRFDLMEYANLRPAMTPGFVRKLTCVIRAMISQPQILVLDSPTTAIDKERSKILIEEVSRQRKQGSLKIILFTTTYEKSFSEWEPISLKLNKNTLETTFLQEVA